MINITESMESYSDMFISICNDILDSEIEVLSYNLVQSDSFNQKYNMVSCLDFQGSTSISVIINTDERVAIKIMELADEPSQLTHKDCKALRAEFGPAFKEVLNTISGRLLRLLQSNNRTLTIRPPKIVYGEVDFPRADTWCMELETNYGLLDFVITVDEMQLGVVRKLEEAQLAGKAKSLFLANVSHEMRTPLNSILGFTSILLSNSNKELTGKMNTALQKVDKNSKHLLNLINHALDMADLDVDNLRIEKKRIDIVPIIQSTYDLLSPSAGAKCLLTSCKLPAEEIHVIGDAARIKQILTNLYSNGIKYTNNGRVNIVTCLKEKDTVKISIVDTGIGIRNEDRKKMFQKFVQLDDSYTKEVEGIGLGLAVCFELAKLHDGFIDYQSEIDVGSVFSLTLPLCGSSLSDTEKSSAQQ